MSELQTAAPTDAGWGSSELAAGSSWRMRLCDADRRALQDAATRGRSGPAAAVSARFRELAHESLRSTGLVLVGNAVDTTLSAQELQRRLRAIVGHIGEVIPQTPSGELVEVLRDKDGDSARDLRFHTDSSDILVLLCLRPALGGGGETLLASARRAYDTLGHERPDLLAELEADWHFDRTGRPGPQMVIRPIFSTDADGSIACYHSPRTARATPGKNGWQLSRDQADALDLLDEVLVRSEVQFRLPMGSGDLLIVVNSKLLHGRAAYIDRGGPRDARQMLRLWLRAPAGGIGAAGAIDADDHADGR